MSGLVVDSTLCTGCRRCVRVCGSEGIKVVGRVAQVREGCISCGMCVDVCPVGALAIEKNTRADGTCEDYHDIWVVCQAERSGELVPVAYELLARGRELAHEQGCRLIAVLGEDTEAEVGTTENERVDALCRAGADEVIRTRDARLAQLDAEVYAAWIAQLARAYKPEIILYGATLFGRELAPRVAVLLQTGLTADCTILNLDSETGLLQQTRPAFGGNLMATIVCPDHRPQMATVRPGIFSAVEPRDNYTLAVSDVALSPDVCGHVHVCSRAAANDAVSITDAEVLVVVGRGIGGKKSLVSLQHFVELLGERLGCVCKLGCTRPVVEAGWLDYAHQVGQTGVSVAPRLLISIGVSGAIQHVAGIGGAETIIAINEDEDAPIFTVAHYKVVGDYHDVVAAWMSQFEAKPVSVA